MEITLESLGFTKKALQEKVIELTVEKLLCGVTYDEDGNVETVDSKLQEKMRKLIKEKIDETVKIFAEKDVLPNVQKYIEDINLQQTNQWGEKQGEKITFIQYLVKCAENYMLEKVDYDGKAQSESSYSWSGKQTRIAYIVDKHLHYSISTAMQNSLKIANDAIAQGIAETVKIKLDEIKESIKVGVSMK